MTSIENNNLFNFLKKDNQEHNNEKRMSEINTYYSEKYKAYGKLALKIVYSLFPIVLINILLKYDIIPRGLGHILLAFIVGISGFYIFFDILSISFRDNMNFDTYDWQYDIRNIKAAENDNSLEDGDGYMKMDSCRDEECCEKETQIYDKLRAKCITKVAEGFIPRYIRSGATVCDMNSTPNSKIEYMSLGCLGINETIVNE